MRRSLQQHAPPPHRTEPHGDGAVANYEDAKTQDTDAFRRFFHSMLEQGVHLPPSSFEAWFVSAAHDDAAVDHVLAALPAAARAAATPD